ncbi:uncharacterized protein [Chiloscyllium punctatum]|uniref:uncharacterized protein n=1 Tax=Chiloscyllium punctatum TaxID=137246 RepID=UPI003B63F996
MTAQLVQCATCLMWQVNDSGVSGSYMCGKCAHIQQLTEHIAALTKELEDLRLIRENEIFLDKTFSDVITPIMPEESRRVQTMRKAERRQVQETPGEVPVRNKLKLLETVESDDTTSSQGGHVCPSKVAAEAERKSRTSHRAVVIGDSIVRGTDRGFCGSRRDLRMVCCFPGARVKDIADRVQDILKDEGEEPEVVVHVGTNDVGKKRRNILQRDFAELGRRLKSRTSKDVTRKMDEGDPVDVVYLDFQKAFDKVPHKSSLCGSPPPFSRESGVEGAARSCPLQPHYGGSWTPSPTACSVVL